MKNEQEITPKDEKKSKLDEAPLALASGMLKNDTALILGWYPLLVLASILDITFPSMPASVLPALDRVLYCGFLYTVAARWVGILRTGAPSFSPQGCARMISFGFLLWLLVFIPVSFGFSAGRVNILILGVIPGALIFLRYFFYFMPIACNIVSPAQVLMTAHQYTRSDTFLPFRVLAVPFGFMALLIALTQSPSPDGTVVFFSYLSAIVSGVYSVLAAYLGIAFGLVFMPEPMWHAAKLDPYRGSRLTTIALQGSGFMTAFLRPARGAIFLAMAIFIWSGNYVRVASLPPPVEVLVKEIQVDGNKVSLSLQLSDHKHSFNGFFPLVFMLAGEKRVVVSPGPNHANLKGETEDIRTRFPTGRTEAEITLQFEANRSGADLVALEDLYLWYRNARLVKLNMKDAKLSSTSTSNATP